MGCMGVRTMGEHRLSRNGVDNENLCNNSHVSFIVLGVNMIIAIYVGSE